MGRSGAVEYGCPTVNKNGTERDNRAEVLQFVLPTWGGREAASADSGKVAALGTRHGTDTSSLAQGERRSVRSRVAATTDGQADAGCGYDAEQRFE